MRKRNLSIDIVKGFCLLCVYAGHCGINAGFISEFWKTFYMSAFFLFSGYLFRYKDGIKNTIYYKFKSLLILYLIWTVVPCAVMKIVQSVHNSFSYMSWNIMFFKILLGIDLPNEVSQLWFVYTLFTVEMIWILIDKVFKSQGTKILTAFVLALFGMILNIFGIHIPLLRLETALIILPVFVLGILGKTYEDKKIVTLFTKMSIPMFIFSGCMWIVMTVLHIRLFSGSVSLWKNTYHFFPLFYFNAVMGTLVAVNIAAILSKVPFVSVKCILKYFAFFGENSTSALVTLNILITMVQYLMNPAAVFYRIPHRIVPIIVFLTVMFLQFPISKILKHKRFKFLLAKF